MRLRGYKCHKVVPNIAKNKSESKSQLKILGLKNSRVVPNIAKNKSESKSQLFTSCSGRGLCCAKYRKEQI